MAKYQEYFQDMLENHQELFDSFKEIHAQFIADPQKNRTAFNTIGEQVRSIVRRYENMLCGKTESGKYGKFSTGLSDKFWGQVRGIFPKIDEVGMQS